MTYKYFCDRCDFPLADCVCHSLSEEERELAEEDICRNRHGDNPESAAANPRQGIKARDRKLIYDAYCKLGSTGSIRETVILALGLREQSGYPRCSELTRDGFLRKTKRKGYTKSGSAAAVLVADIYSPDYKSPEEEN